MKLRTLTALALALCLAAGLALGASAHEAVNMDAQGSISVHMKYDGAAVPGGRMALYKVAAVAETDGDYSFAPTAAFAPGIARYAQLNGLTDFALDQQTLDAPGDLPKWLYSYTKIAGITAVEVKDIDQQGTVTFENLGVGLYLLAETSAASGYQAAEPFFVSLPTRDPETQAYVYHVTADSKMEPLRPATPTPAPPETPATPVPTQPPTLPQTGQLNWPVPVLAVLGLAAFSLGWLKYKKGNGGNG